MEHQMQTVKKAVRNATLLVSVIFLLLGVVFLGIGAGFGIREQAMHARCTEPAVGTVIELKSNKSEAYLPIIEFETATRKMRVNTGIYESPEPFETGEQVNLLYNPDRPKEFYIKDYAGFTLFTVIFCAVGGAFALVGIVLLIVWLVRKQRSKEQQQLQQNLDAGQWSPQPEEQQTFQQE